MPTAFITGNSSGLGRGLTEAWLEDGWEVYGCSRRGASIDAPAYHDQRCDLAEPGAIPDALEALLGGCPGLDLAVLNAGILGEIQPLRDTTLEEIRRVMDVNVWANKVVLDWLLARGLAPAQCVLISSGASVNGNYGWGAYALSKATLNMLAKLYAHEMPDTHVSALAPGLVDTAMQDHLHDHVDGSRFPSVRRLQEAKGTPAMPGPREAAEAVIAALPRLGALPSGSYADLRTL